MNISVENYRVDCHIKMEEFTFLDIMDKRNGEVYVFYKHNQNDKYYTFDSCHQQHCVNSMTEKTVWKNRKKDPFDFDIIKVAKERPENPFKRFGEYDIILDKYGQVCEIKEI